MKDIVRHSSLFRAFRIQNFRPLTLLFWTLIAASDQLVSSSGFCLLRCPPHTVPGVVCQADQPRRIAPHLHGTAGPLVPAGSTPCPSAWHSSLLSHRRAVPLPSLPSCIASGPSCPGDLPSAEGLEEAAALEAGKSGFEFWLQSDGLSDPEKVASSP